MKKKIQEFIRSLGGSSSYAGNTEKCIIGKDKRTYVHNVKTLFINDPARLYAENFGCDDIQSLVFMKFGINLPFTLKLNTNA